MKAISSFILHVFFFDTHGLSFLLGSQEGPRGYSATVLDLKAGDVKEFCHERSPSSVGLRNNWEELIVGWDDGVFRVWNWPGVCSTTDHSGETEENEGLFGTFLLSANGKRVVTYSENSRNVSYCVWDTQTGKKIFSGYEPTICGGYEALSPNGAKLASYSKDGLFLWDTENPSGKSLSWIPPRLLMPDCISAWTGKCCCAIRVLF